MFVKRLDQVTKQTNDKTNMECQGKTYVNDYLIRAISIWCNELKISPSISDNILKSTNQNKIRELADYIYTEWNPEKKEKNIHNRTVKVSYTITKLNKLVVNLTNIRNEEVKFIALIAFGITAIGYFFYRLNEENENREQQISCKEKPKQHNSNLPSFTFPYLPAQTITKQFLILVVSASKADLLELMKAKGHISVSDGEVLYEITKYLWLGSETDFNRKRASINQYELSKKEKSEYDIYLVYIELNQAVKGFEPNVNQLDRYDAFIKLSDLGVELKVSPRLQMEAYENIDVYSR